MESDEVAAVPFAVPGAPTGLEAAPGDGLVLLEWDDTHDPAISGWEYNLRRSDGPFGEDWTYVPGSSAPASRYTVIGLENGVSYAFKLRAVAGDRIGRESEEVSARPVGGLPSAPEKLRAMSGDRRTTLLWEDAQNPSITRWQYRYRTTGAFAGWNAIADTDPSLTAYTVTGLTIGVVHYFQVRAGSDSGFGPPSETAAVSPEPPKPERPTGLKVLPGDGKVALTWDDPDDDAIVRWQHVARASSDIGPDRWLDIAGSDAKTTRYVVEALENGVAHVFRVRSCTGKDRLSPICSPGSDPVSATPRAAVKPVERGAAKAVLAGLAGRVAAGAEAVIGARFSADRTTARLVLAGREVPLAAPIREEEAKSPAALDRRPIVVGMQKRDVLRDSAVHLPLGPPDGGNALRWSLWHRGELKAFQGSTGRQARYGGRLLSVWYGADMRWNKHWLAGAAVARSKGEVEYAAGASSGLLKTTLDSVHPYLQRRFGEGGTVWIMLGGGRGTMENATSRGGTEIADAEMATISAGFRSLLPEFGGLDFSASGAAGLAYFEADGDVRTAIGSLSASTDRQSLGIEAAVEEGNTSRYTSLSLRRDGGDGVSGAGLEFASGFRSPLPASSGHVDMRARWLARHSDREYREFGLTATVRQAVGAGGRGPSWSLALAHGTADSGRREPEPLWSGDAAGQGDNKAAPTLDLRAGWGFVSGGAVFAPRAAFGLTGVDARRLAFGIDLGPPTGPTLKLAAERRIPRTGATESRLTAAMRFRF